MLAGNTLTGHYYAQKQKEKTMTTNNTIRAFISTGSDVPFAYDVHERDAVASMREQAAVRGLVVRRENVKFLGEVEHPESFVNRDGIVTYGFEAEATGS